MEQTPPLTELGERIAGFVERRRLHHPALLMLEMLRPFTGGLSVVSEGMAPFFSLCLGQGTSASLKEFLSNSENLSRLIDRLEQTADAKQVING